MEEALSKKIIELWHISRTALGNKDCSMYNRMIYIKQELLKNNSELVAGMKNKQIWFAIENEIK